VVRCRVLLVDLLRSKELLDREYTIPVRLAIDLHPGSVGLSIAFCTLDELSAILPARDERLVWGAAYLESLQGTLPGSR
jgi:hypothetical protein